MLFDEGFNWEPHTNLKIRSAYAKLKNFYSLKKSLSVKTKARLVECYVLSQLNYCNMVTQAVTAELKNKIQKVQNACIRFIFGLRKYDHITQYLTKLDTLNMENRVKSHALTLLHKIVNNIAPKYLSDKLSYRRNIHNHNTRRRNTLNVRRLHTAKKNNAFFVKTVNEYNALLTDSTITTEDSICSFKTKIKRNLKQSQLHG